MTPSATGIGSTWETRYTVQKPDQDEKKEIPQTLVWSLEGCKSTVWCYLPYQQGEQQTWKGSSTEGGPLQLFQTMPFITPRDTFSDSLLKRSQEPNERHPNQADSGEVEQEWLENPVTPVTEVQNRSRMLFRVACKSLVLQSLKPLISPRPLWGVVHHLLNQVGLHCGFRTVLEWLHVRQHGSWTLLELLHAEIVTKFTKGHTSCSWVAGDGVAWGP